MAKPLVSCRDEPGRDAAKAGAVGVLLALAGGWILAHRPAGSPNGQIFADNALDIGLLLGITGSFVVAAAFGGRFMPQWHGRTAWRLVWLGPAVLALVLVGLHVARTKTAVIAGTRFFWLDDDMMISMRYARNLAQGAGLVWNAGEPPVEGFSNLLWTLCMAAVQGTGLPIAKASAGVLALGGVLLAGVMAQAAGLARRLGLTPLEALVPLTMLAANRWLIYWTAGGSEATLLALGCLWLANRFLDSRRHRPLGWGSGWALGLLGLVRADALVLVAVYLAIWRGLGGAGRTRRWAWLPAIGLPLLATAWRWAYYGDLLPNTYYLRMTGIPSRAAMGVFYLHYFLMLAGGLVTLTWLHGLLGRRRAGRWLAGVPLAVLAYGLYAGGDELAEYRFYAPVAPMLLVLAAAAAARALRRAARGVARPRLRLAWLTVAMVAAGSHTLLLPKEFTALGHGRGEMEANNVRIGLLLKAHTRPAAQVAHVWAGAAPFFSERPAIDMLGKNDRHIARLTASPDDKQPGHNKFDAPYVFGRLRPDVVVAALAGDLIRDPERFAAAPEREMYGGLFHVLEAPGFWTDYAPGMISLPLSRQFHGIFVRVEGALADPPALWQPFEPGP